MSVRFNLKELDEKTSNKIVKALTFRPQIPPHLQKNQKYQQSLEPIRMYYTKRRRDEIYLTNFHVFSFKKDLIKIKILVKYTKIQTESSQVNFLKDRRNHSKNLFLFSRNTIQLLLLSILDLEKHSWALCLHGISTRECVSWYIEIMSENNG